ncbi:glutamate--cysteine ligase [Amycolatopsis sp. ATCC 39116]|uniref:carboxylate-amine ligase n=1 Tax=Amycolatopsis sp. (strain ATCC 39116 / 75iv2) TaxID=385957 RepID=UPI0002627DBB|nr:glutamate--cysteine ligase [Amycolatopsis sp. ATCC 39116]
MTVTVGVEEEFLLVDRRNRLAAAAPAVLAGSDDVAGELQPEMVSCQVESVTPVREQSDELLECLRDQRARLRDGAASAGLRLLAAGSPPMSADPVRLSPGRRYRRIADHFRGLMSTAHVCGCHIHLGVPDSDTGVRVINHVRPWLPVLLAVSANSPFAEGADTGYASWWYLAMSRWPSGGPPPYAASAGQYEELVDEMARSGAIMDPGNLYWDMRLSPRHPTVEIRVCDVAATEREAALLAVLAQGLAATAFARIGDGVDAPRVPQEVLRADLWRAARDGLDGTCVDPVDRVLRPVPVVLARLLDEVRPHLDGGAKEFAEQAVPSLVAAGGGASRQRAAFERGGVGAVVELLTGSGNYPEVPRGGPR